jgi:hypothetical protein
MKKQFRFIVAVASAVVLVGGIAYTADQTILGRVLTIRDRPDHPNQRRITGSAKEKGSPNTLVGNPTVSGATLFVSAQGANPSSQSFTLPAAGWTGSAATGFKYKDPNGAFSAIKRAQIKRSSNGTFTIKAIANGSNGPVNVVPPNPGVSGCMALALGGGDTYHVLFGPGSQIRNKGPNLFQAKRPPNEGLCPIVTTTTTIATTTTIVTTTSTSSTTTTTIYGSPSRAFLVTPSDLLD